MEKKKLYIIILFSILLLSLSGVGIYQSIKKEEKVNQSKNKIEELGENNNFNNKETNVINSSEEKENIEIKENAEIKEKVVDPKKENIVNNANDNKKEYTTNNKKETIINNDNNNKIEDVSKKSKKVEIKEEEINANNNQASSTTNNTSFSNNHNNTNIEEKQPKAEEPIIQIPTQEEKNDTYRKQLQDKYGIKIAYGNELGNYSATGVQLTKMTDPNIINEYLNKINNVLSLYPTGFFREIINYNMPLTIYLVDAVGNGQYAGLLDSRVLSDMKLTIRKYSLFERTLHHELFHYIDAYLKQRMAPNSVEDTWNSLNPVGFVYGTTISSYTFSGSPGAYFINNYSQTNYKEDRATLFADMMSRTFKNSYMNEGEPILLKMRRIAEELDTYFQTVTSTNKEHWERWIY
ncbi:MAG: hypothetical protein PUB18_02235 [bacterium]|nr:hypothetical protein [bacterium]